MDATSLSLRSVAAHERDHKGNAELAAVIGSAADENERLRSALRKISVAYPCQTAEMRTAWFLFGWFCGEAALVLFTTPPSVIWRNWLELIHSF